MPIIGSNFNEVSAKKEILELKPSDQIVLAPPENNVNIVDINERTLHLGRDTKVLVFIYEFKTEFKAMKPKNVSAGKIEIKGEILYVDTEKTMKKIISDWRKNKKVDVEFMEKILNVILNDAQIEAILLSKHVLLPSPVQLPRIKRQQQGKKK